jgi:hypothetical protein
MERPAPYVGVAACIAAVLSVLAPYVLISEPGTGLAIYYGAGPVGGFGVAVLSLLGVVAFLSGERGSADPATAAGVSLAIGVATFGVALVWAFSVDTANVLSFPTQWMEWHRWLVLALSAVVAGAGGVYAREVL